MTFFKKKKISPLRRGAGHYGVTDLGGDGEPLLLPTGNALHVGGPSPP